MEQSFHDKKRAKNDRLKECMCQMRYKEDLLEMLRRLLKDERCEVALGKRVLKIFGLLVSSSS